VGSPTQPGDMSGTHRLDLCHERGIFPLCTATFLRPSGRCEMPRSVARQVQDRPLPFICMNTSK
jgi:hypothetical protein